MEWLGFNTCRSACFSKYSPDGWSPYSPSQEVLLDVDDQISETTVLSEQSDHSYTYCLRELYVDLHSVNIVGSPGLVVSPHPIHFEDDLLDDVLQS